MYANEVNQVFLCGNLGKNPESKVVPSGSQVSKFTLATKHSYKSGNEWKTETDWHNIEVWGHEKLIERLRVGNLLMVFGRIKTDKYTDKSGVEKYITKIVADKICLPEQRGEGGKSAAAPRSQQSSARQAQQSAASEWDESEWDDPGDDVPF